MEHVPENLKTNVSEEEYKSYLAKTDFSSYTKSDEKEVETIEDLLELKRGTLKDQAYYVGKQTCKCGRPLSFIDFVTTAISEHNHTRPFLAHALLGTKYGFQNPRSVKCSSCGEIYPLSTYKTPNYSCREGGGII